MEHMSSKNLAVFQADLEAGLIMIVTKKDYYKLESDRTDLLAALKRISELQAGYYEIGIGYDNAVNNIANWVIANVERSE